MDEEMKEKEFVNLENRIWKTYQSRIITATRLLNNSKLLDFYSTIYTICLTLLSVFTLINGDKLINYFSVFISIIVMGIVFYGNTMNYKDRYINMKDNYLKLGNMYYKCLNERINKNYDMEKIYEEYSNLLNTVENHSKYDYLSYRLNDINEKGKVPFLQKFIYWFRKTMLFILKIIIFVIPIFFVIVSFIRMI
ncbi:MAG: SLATT domain-containing protein [Bacilli bacterium]|nr:SLATT domain-containing protein [Bacilli bacterium]